MRLRVPRSTRWWVLLWVAGFVGALALFAFAPPTLAAVTPATVSSAPTAAANSSAALAPAPASLAAQVAQAVGSLRRAGFVNVDRREGNLVHRFYASSTLRPSPKGLSPEATARAFLQEHALAFFGRELSAPQPGAAQLRSERVRTSLTGTHLWHRQYVNGVAVEGGWVAVHLDPKGRIMEVESTYRPGLLSLDPRPTISAEAAMDAARAAVGAEGPPRAAEMVELVIDAARRRLVWKVTQALWAPYGDWCSEIDARDGSVLQTRNLMADGKDFAHAVRILDPPSLPSPGDSPVVSSAQLATGSGLVLPDNPLNGHPERYDLRDGDPMDGFREQKTLYRLDGSGLLRGAYADAWTDFTTQPSEPDLVFDFSADLVHSPFHAVNAYWHIDTVQDYLQTTLGITSANNRSTRIYAHASQNDNSVYSPVTDDIRFGDGGVDDAEDGEIVVHEYGHAIHENIVPNYTNSGETGAISEGFGDYLAASFGGNALVGEWDATSYNPGPPPYLRRTDGNKMYPADIDHEVHDDGEIISPVWWRLWNELGKQTADILVVESLFHIGPNATFRDFADAMLLVDDELFSSIHAGTIYDAYKDRGIPLDYDLRIFHTALGDTEDLQGPYLVDAQILHGHALAPTDPVQLYWRSDTGDPWTIVAMTDQGSGNWSASIPGPGHSAVIEYAITVIDEFSVRIWDPIGALENSYSFSVAMDKTPPTLSHTPLKDMLLQNWPPLLRAEASDASGIAQVTAAWSLNGKYMGNFPLLPQGGGLYEAPISYPVQAMQVGDQIEYVITATDASLNSNSTQSGLHDFSIIESAGTVLVIADDTAAALDAGKFDARKNPLSPPDAGDLAAAPVDREAGDTASLTGDAASLTGDAASLATDLRNAGFIVSEENAATSDPAHWSDFDFLVLSFGANTSPATDEDFRLAVRAWASQGGKLLVEGGEIGFDATVNPAYPDFAREVLHEQRWKDDTSGALIAAPQSGGHPLLTTPNPLPSTLAFIDSGEYGEQDTVVPDGDAVVVYGTESDPAAGGILVYDDDTSPSSAQIVVWSFAYSALSNRSAAAALTENTARFLVAPQPAATSSLAGTVSLVGMDPVGGLRVWAEPSHISTETTDDGSYLLSPLYPGDYTVWAEGPDGWETARLDATLQEGQSVTQFDFRLRPLTVSVYADSTSVEIPDGDPAGITRTITVDQGEAVAELKVHLEIEHPWRGDLEVSLISPSGTTVTLHNRTGSSLDNIFADYPDSTNVDGPGSLEDFREEVAQGDWTLRVIDWNLGDAGRLLDWRLELSTVSNHGVGILVSDLTAKPGEGGVHLSFVSVAGAAEGFLIRRSVDHGPWTLRTRRELLPEENRVQFVDEVDGLPTGSTLRYAIDGVDATGITHSSLAEVSLVLQQASTRILTLLQNQPNPFNPRTAIVFRMPREDRVSLRVYDVAGRLVTTLLEQELPEGRHRVFWDGTDAAGGPVGSGTYFYELRTPAKRLTKAMVLLK